MSMCEALCRAPILQIVVTAPPNRTFCSIIMSLDHPIFCDALFYHIPESVMPTAARAACKMRPLYSTVRVSE